MLSFDEQSLLCQIIVDFVLKENVNFSVQMMKLMAKQIVDVFPKEVQVKFILLKRFFHLTNINFYS